MRLILVLILSAVGYHYVSGALTSRPDGTQLPSLSSLATQAGDTASTSSWLDTIRSYLNGAAQNLHSTVSNVTVAIPENTRQTLSDASRKVQDTVHLRGAGCGEPDRDGNLHYCFHDNDH